MKIYKPHSKSEAPPPYEDQVNLEQEFVEQSINKTCVDQGVQIDEPMKRNAETQTHVIDKKVETDYTKTNNNEISNDNINTPKESELKGFSKYFIDKFNRKKPKKLFQPFSKFSSNSTTFTVYSAGLFMCEFFFFFNLRR